MNILKNLSLVLLVAGSTVSLRAAEGWHKLWDGKTLAGWHVIGKGEWKVVDGAIHGTHDRSEAEFGHLVTDRAFTNFTVRLRYKAVKGNSGLYFRIEEKGYSGVSGFQAEIDPDKDAGGLYETNGRAWVVQPKPEDVKRWYKPNQWNEMTVTARGRNVVVHVNGQKSAEIKDDPGRLSGKIALQLHAGQDGDVWFRDIQIKELPAD
jgi:3-keto-disaccharide hydrolase